MTEVKTWYIEITECGAAAIKAATLAEASEALTARAISERDAIAFVPPPEPPEDLGDFDARFKYALQLDYWRCKYGRGGGNYVVPAPPELAEWLDVPFAATAVFGDCQLQREGIKVYGGWIILGVFIPVFGASGITVIQETADAE